MAKAKGYIGGEVKQRLIPLFVEKGKCGGGEKLLVRKANYLAVRNSGREGESDHSEEELAALTDEARRCGIDRVDASRYFKSSYVQSMTSRIGPKAERLKHGKSQRIYRRRSKATFDPPLRRKGQVWRRLEVAREKGKLPIDKETTDLLKKNKISQK